jgi:hypothetical protein
MHYQGMHKNSLQHFNYKYKNLKNNIIGFVVYLLATILLSPSAGVILLAMKENSDRCHYYGGKWNITDLAIGMAAVSIGVAVRYFFGFHIF